MVYNIIDKDGFINILTTTITTTTTTTPTTTTTTTTTTAAATTTTTTNNNVGIYLHLDQSKYDWIKTERLNVYIKASSRTKLKFNFCFMNSHFVRAGITRARFVSPPTGLRAL